MSQQWDALIKDLNDRGGKATQTCINDPVIKEALKNAFDQRESKKPSLETPFLDSALMQPIFKDSLVPQSPLSLQDFIIKSINRMQAQQPSSH